jgi:hypothetical protein
MKKIVASEQDTIQGAIHAEGLSARSAT